MKKRKEDKKMSEKYRKKVKVAVIFGGYSSEYSVSLESSSAVIKNLDPEKYEVLPVGITKEGQWFSYTGPVENIENDTWHLLCVWTKTVRIWWQRQLVSVYRKQWC